MKMMSPEPLPGNHAVDFRAPPPSPEAPGRRSSLTNDDVLTEFLHQSLKVPDLILPDRVFPRQKSVTNPPKLDLMKFESLESEQAMKILDLTAQVGCLEVTNHGISSDLIKLVLNSGAGIFGISPEKKKKVAKSPDRIYGFEEFQGEEENRDENEEFLWCGDEAMKLEMEGIWPIGYSNFSEKMDKLSEQIEEIAGKILIFLQQKSLKKMWDESGATMEQEVVEKLCHIHKHGQKRDGGGCGGSGSENSLRYDVIRMLIKGSEFPHALCLHICSGSTDFHVYSKKGWVSFCPNQDSIVITVGNKLQAWSDGHYRHVIGRPVFKGEDEDCISLSFLISPPNISKFDKNMTISLTQQIIIAVFITIIYQFLVFVCTVI